MVSEEDSEKWKRMKKRRSSLGRTVRSANYEKPSTQATLIIRKEIRNNLFSFGFVILRILFRQY